jgi:hypothetical protein
MVTMTHAALSVFLQPFAHCLLQILKHDSSIGPGLSRGYQAWEWYLAMNEGFRQKSLTGDLRDLSYLEFYLIAGDYEEATDHIDHSRALPAVKAYLQRIGFWSSYVRLCVELLLSPRFFDAVENRKGEIIEDEFETCRGSLMGEPGTKIILTILTRCAAEYAKKKTPGGAIAHRFFASAGDDQFGIGDIEYFRNLWEGAELYGLKPSKEKFGAFRIGVNYCE